MEQILQRGYAVADGVRIRTMVAQGQKWQLYLTNRNHWVLVATAELVQFWTQTYGMEKGIFQKLDAADYFLLSSPDGYLISAMEAGPYPQDSRQIEAFSLTFARAREQYPQESFQNAIYLEAYSLLLPTGEKTEICSPDVVYGRWLTGGVQVSICQLERVSRLLSWLPRSILQEYVRKAGFDVPGGKPGVALAETDRRGPGPLTLKTAESGEFRLLGRPELERFFRDNILDLIQNAEAYQRMGISFPGATVLHGPPGCGKTYAVEQLAQYLGWPRFDIDSQSIGSPYIHETSRKISEIFQQAIEAAPSVLVIDEMEAFLSERGNALTSGLHHAEEVAEFLRRIPEAVSKGVLIFAMTNMVDMIDPAILRRGRFDHVIEVKMPSADEISALLRAKFQELPVDETVQVPVIAGVLDGHPMSDVVFVLREAGRLAVKSGLAAMSQACFLQAMEQLPDGQKRNKIGF